MAVSTRFLRLILAGIGVALVGFLAGEIIDVVRGHPGWDITGASIGLHAGILYEARRLGLLGATEAQREDQVH